MVGVVGVHWVGVFGRDRLGAAYLHGVAWDSLYVGISGQSIPFFGSAM